MYILIGGVDYSSFYKSGSLKVTSRTGADKSSFTFTLENPDVVPDEEREVIVYDSVLMRQRIARGRLKRTKRKILGPDGNAAFSDRIRFGFDVEVQGFLRDVERRPPISAVYINKTTGFIARDVAGQVPGLDISLVGIGGLVLDYFETRHEAISSILNRLAAIEQTQWWVDTNKQLHFEDPTLTPAPFSMTDDTWADYAGLSLTAEPDDDNLANSLRLYYNGKYSEGQVNVFNGSNQITGVPGTTKWFDQITPGSKFRLSTISNISYTVQEVRSDTLIILSSAYNEATSLAPVNYLIENIPRATAADDLLSQLALSTITGDDGKFCAVINGPEVYLTYLEARDYLLAILKQRANPVININFKSTNVQIAGQLEAGMSVLFQLTQWGMDTTLQINQLSIKDTGGETEDGYPVLAYDFRFETYLYDLAAKLRKKEYQADFGGRQDVSFIEQVLTASEIMSITETAGLLVPLRTSEVTVITESPTTTSYVQPGPYVWGPSVKTWATGADWAMGTLDGVIVSGGGITLPDYSQTGVTFSAFGGTTAAVVAAGGALTIPATRFTDFLNSEPAFVLLTEDGDVLTTEAGNPIGLEDPYAGVIMLQVYVSATHKTAGTAYYLLSANASGEGSNLNSLRLLVGSDGNLRLKTQSATGTSQCTVAMSTLTAGLHWIAVQLTADQLVLWVDGNVVGSVSNPALPASWPTAVYLLTDKVGASPWESTGGLARAVVLRGKPDDSVIAAQQAGSMPIWIAGVTASQSDFTGSTFQLVNEGAWTSDTQVQYSDNARKSRTLTETVPAGAAVVEDWRSGLMPNDLIGGNPLIASMPNSSFMAASLFLSASNTGLKPTVSLLSYNPNRNTLVWNRGTWGPAPTRTVDTQADWLLWSLAGTSANELPGSLSLKTGYNYGIATSPWWTTRHLMLVKTITLTASTPGLSTIVQQFRSSPDGLDAHASVWETDIRIVPENLFWQTRFFFTGNGSTPSVDKMVSYPA